MHKHLPAEPDQLSAILNNIRKLRKSHGFKQTDMAEALNISHNSYSRKETGRVSFTVTEFFILAEILKVEPVQLVKPVQITGSDGK